jgi:hypothetical protein
VPLANISLPNQLVSQILTRRATNLGWSARVIDGSLRFFCLPGLDFHLLTIMTLITPDYCMPDLCILLRNVLHKVGARENAGFP